MYLKKFNKSKSDVTHSMLYRRACYKILYGQRDRERQRETQRDRGRQREIEGDRKRQREIKGDRGRQKEIAKDRNREL